MSNSGADMGGGGIGGGGGGGGLLDVGNKTSGGGASPGETRVNIPSAHQSLTTSEDESIDDIPNSFPTSGWKQFVILFKRTFLSIIRDGVS